MHIYRNTEPCPTCGAQSNFRCTGGDWGRFHCKEHGDFELVRGERFYTAAEYAALQAERDAALARVAHLEALVSQAVDGLWRGGQNMLARSIEKRMTKAEPTP